jgi:hypothetical protein
VDIKKEKELRQKAFAAIQQKNYAELSNVVQDISALASSDGIGSVTIDSLIETAKFFAASGDYLQAAFTSEIAARHAPFGKEQETLIVSGLLEYAEHIADPSRRKELFEAARRYAPPDSTLESLAERQQKELETAASLHPMRHKVMQGFLATIVTNHPKIG